MQISVIIPCLNEEKTIGACVRKAQLGISSLGYEGEVLVIDNGSTDATKKIAQELGAKVVAVEERGYGNAVQGGLAHALGTYVVIGDGDDSYDFSVLPSFIQKMEKENLELVVGNRFTGKIEKNAMPFLNRYFGNPVLSGIGRILYGNVCGDFHSGLRAGKRESLQRLNLSTQKMEMATEMIIKAAVHKLRIGELPITLYKDGRGRAPHLRRWHDGFICLIYMLQYRFFKNSLEK